MSIGKLIVLSGPGGVGKSTIVKVLKTHPEFFFSVSATTRLPRPGEVDGEAYHFVSDQEFDSMIQSGEFLEWAEFAGARYGTPNAPVDAALALGKNVLLEIEIAGARQVRSKRRDALLVFLEPPSFNELEERIRGRATDSEERVKARLALAREEMAAANEFDHRVVNHRVEEVVEALVSLAARQ
ncbi:MAG: guanylate kinase [Actinobacteria bacterium]|jgi:guanylate kinase|nr:guanylate kinase [Actinomycetota bacterium]NDA38983.1 guanylate kinase [Actinomycetota bacterium]NDE12480.1 guanylate kinase [Actinomycetota bacterium]NDE83579.1 guanylate kinase [Actinomycetota bacterium]